MVKRNVKPRKSRKVKQRGGVVTGIKDLNRMITGFLTAEDLGRIEAVDKQRTALAKQAIKKRDMNFAKLLTGIHTRRIGQAQMNKIEKFLLPLMTTNSMLKEVKSIILQKDAIDVNTIGNLLAIINKSIDESKVIMTLLILEVQVIYIKKTERNEAMTKFLTTSTTKSLELLEAISSQTFADDASKTKKYMKLFKKVTKQFIDLY